MIGDITDNGKNAINKRQTNRGQNNGKIYAVIEELTVDGVKMVFHNIYTLSGAPVRDAF